jgi:hypothetical protein
MTPLLTIKTSKHPLNWKRYSKLYDELNAAANGFADLGHHDLADAIGKARAELWNAWNLIQTKERAELEEAGR